MYDFQGLRDAYLISNNVDPEEEEKSIQSSADLDALYSSIDVSKL